MPMATAQQLKDSYTVPFGQKSCTARGQPLKLAKTTMHLREKQVKHVGT